MYTIQDYIVDIKEKANELYTYLQGLDKSSVQAALKLIVHDDFFTAKSLISNSDKQEVYKDTLERLRVANLINRVEDNLKLEAYSTLSKVLCTLAYYKEFPNELMIEEDLRFILFSFSELNPHKDYLAQIYNELSAGNYDPYLLLVRLSTGCFMNYPNSTVKILYNKYETLVLDGLFSEAYVALVSEGKDISGLRYLKSFYIPEKVNYNDTYRAIALYDGGNLYEADTAYTATPTSANLPQAIELNQKAIDSYKDSQLKVNKEAIYVEPIYVNNPNEGDNYLCVNYPFIEVDLLKAKEMLL